MSLNESFSKKFSESRLCQQKFMTHTPKDNMRNYGDPTKCIEERVYHYTQQQSIMSHPLIRVVTLTRPPTSSSLRITDRSFQYASPRLWNQLPASLRQPRTCTLILTHLFLHLPPQSPLLTHHCHHPSLRRCFTPGQKPSCSTNHFHPRLLSLFRTDSMVSCPAPFRRSISVCFFSFFHFTGF